MEIRRVHGIGMATRQGIDRVPCDPVHMRRGEGVVPRRHSRTEGSILPTIFDFLYREYCRARLIEMRKQLWLRPGSNDVPQANCDSGHLDGAARGEGVEPQSREEQPHCELTPRAVPK